MTLKAHSHHRSQMTASPTVLHFIIRVTLILASRRSPPGVSLQLCQTSFPCARPASPLRAISHLVASQVYFIFHLFSFFPYFVKTQASGSAETFLSILRPLIKTSVPSCFRMSCYLARRHLNACISCILHQEKECNVPDWGDISVTSRSCASRSFASRASLSFSSLALVVAI